MKFIYFVAAIALHAASFTTPFAAAQTNGAATTAVVTSVESPLGPTTAATVPDSSTAAATSAAPPTTIKSPTSSAKSDSTIEATTTPEATTATTATAQTTKPKVTTPPPSPTNVLPPLPGTGTIADKLASDGRFTSLVNAASTTGLLQDFMLPGPWTVFAPTNTAFSQIQDLMDTITIEDLTQVLTYHVADGLFFLQNGKTLTTVNGAQVTLTVGIIQLKVNNANIDETMLASNGVLYVIDQVLIPPSLSSPTAATTPLPSGFTSPERISPVFYRGCLEVDGDGNNDDAIKLGTCSSTKPSQEFTYDGTFIHPGGDTSKCLQAGRLDTPANGMYMRLYDCDESNILQQFEWDFRNAGPIQLTGRWSAFCVVFRGVEENLDVDPIILQRCEALSPRALEWMIYE